MATEDSVMMSKLVLTVAGANAAVTSGAGSPGMAMWTMGVAVLLAVICVSM